MDTLNPLVQLEQLIQNFKLLRGQIASYFTMKGPKGFSLESCENQYNKLYGDAMVFLATHLPERASDDAEGFVATVQRKAAVELHQRSNSNFTVYFARRVISALANFEKLAAQIDACTTTLESYKQQYSTFLESKEANKIQQFDICIVCALAEEARAVINEFSDRCSGTHFEQAFSKVTGYEYQHTMINNNKGEQLTVLVIWMPFTGPVETVNSVRSLLEEFHPRFVAMTGICAGDKETKQVALGDLVAAAYAFHYEEGKVEADENGQDRLRPEWRTHGTAKRIVQYLNHFATWEAPVIEMKQRKLGRELREEERPKCLIAPIASGMAVQGNNPFPRLLEHNRKALFFDQEVAAFYQTLNEFPDVYFLAVKGVCDHGDKNKNDVYREYAARASAIYLLYFIRDYITTDLLLRRN